MATLTVTKFNIIKLRELKLWKSQKAKIKAYNAVFSVRHDRKLTKGRYFAPPKCYSDFLAQSITTNLHHFTRELTEIVVLPSTNTTVLTLLKI